MGLFDDFADYTPVQTSMKPSAGFDTSVQANQDYANRSPTDFQNDLNQGVKEKSNLMGPQDPVNKESQALGARGNQIYQSAVNQITRQSALAATDRQNVLQTQNLEQRAQLYSSVQSRARLNWEQVSYQRDSAIQAETIKRNLYASIFGGVASLGGTALGAGMYNARRPSSIEPNTHQNQALALNNGTNNTKDPYSYFNGPNPYSSGGQ